MPVSSRSAKLIVVDWGTTNLRVYLTGEHGECLSERSSQDGLLNSRGCPWRITNLSWNWQLE